MQNHSYARSALPKRALLGAVVLGAALGSSGCALVNQVLGGVGQGGGVGGVNALPPTVNAQPLRLTRTPTLRDLGAYYCPQVITDPIARLGCTVAVGAPPQRDSLVFEFATLVTVKNPNNIPVPALDILLALRLFQGQEAESLGSICLSMCGSNDPYCSGSPKPGACTSNQNTIRTVNDFVSAIPGLIAGIASGAVQNELRKSTIAAGGDVQLNLAFQLGIDQALRVFQKVIQRYVQDQLQRRNTALEVPVSGEGTVFVQLPGIGRLGVGFGPLQTMWRIL